MRAGRATLSIVLAVAAGAIFAPGANAAPYTLGFNADADGFSVFQFQTGGGEYYDLAPEYVSTDGNPGGFIRYTDPDSGSPEDTKARFRPPAGPDIDHLGGVVSFDVRSTATGIVDDVFVTVEDTAGNKVSCAFGAPGAAWTSYAAQISASNPCWKDAADGTDATPSDLLTIFENEEGSWFVNADFGTGSGEVSDLDTFAIQTAPPPVERALTIKYKKRAEAFIGFLTQPDGPAGDDCVQSVEVELYQAGATNKLLGSDLTDENGKWKIKKRARTDKMYYALAPELNEPACAEATSNMTEPL